MKRLEYGRKCIYPSLVSIRILTKLHSVGICTTEQVHNHILHGTLQGILGRW